MSKLNWIRIDNVPTKQGYALVVEGTPEHAEFLALSQAAAVAPEAPVEVEEVVEEEEEVATPTPAPAKPRPRKK